MLPLGWDGDAQAQWEAGHKAEAIGRALTILDKTQHPVPELALQAAYYLYLVGDVPFARNILEITRKAHPEHLEVLQNLAVMHNRLGAFQKARATFERYLALGGSNANAFDGLCAACHKLGDLEAARAWGRRAIDEKTRVASTSPYRLKLGKRRQAGDRMIAFSLWGSKPRYLRGALENLIRSTHIYPGYRCRFYVDESVPADFAAALEANGAELVRNSGEPGPRRRLTRRFLVADDPRVSVYLVRDCDSVINSREAAAVEEWLASGKAFHVMRDWWTHTDPMLAGMWGGLGGILPPLAPLLAGYKAAAMETPSWDQWFLRDRIWPSVSDAALVHDRLFATPGSHDFPGPLPAGDFHVGQDEFAVRAAEQATELASFRGKIGSLAL